jgi:hypothetical protein
MVKRKFASQLKLPSEDGISIGGTAPQRKRARSASVSGSVPRFDEEGQDLEQQFSASSLAQSAVLFPAVKNMPKPLDFNADDARLVKISQALRKRVKIKSEEEQFQPPEWTFPNELIKGKKKKKAQDITVKASLENAQHNALIISEIMEAGEGGDLEDVEKDLEEKKDIEEEDNVEDEEDNLFDEDDYTQSYYYEGDAALDDDGAFGNDEE